jgi:hypothetical protein
VVDSAARNKRTGDSVAVKKVTKIFSKKILTKRALRELKCVALAVVRTSQTRRI